MVIPKKRALIKNVNKLVKNARKRFDHNLHEQTEQIIQKVREENYHKLKLRRKDVDPNEFENQVAARNFPRRHIYFILDGQDLD